MPVQNQAVSIAQRMQCYKNLPARTRNGPPVAAANLGPSEAWDVSVVRTEILSDGRAGTYAPEFAHFGMTKEHFGALAKRLATEHHAHDTMESVRVGCATVSSLGLFRTESVRYQTRERMGKVCEALNREYVNSDFSFEYRPAIYGEKARILVRAQGKENNPVPGTPRRDVGASPYNWNTVDDFDLRQMSSSLRAMGVPAKIAIADALKVSSIKSNHSESNLIFFTAIGSVCFPPLGLIPALLGDKTNIQARTKEYSQFIQGAQAQANSYGIAYGLHRNGNSVILSATKLGAGNA